MRSRDVEFPYDRDERREEEEEDEDEDELELDERRRSFDRDDRLECVERGGGLRRRPSRRRNLDNDAENVNALRLTSFSIILATTIAI